MLQKYLNMYSTYPACFQARKTGWDQLDQSFVSLEISKIMRDQRLDRGCGLWQSWEFPVLGGLGPVQSQFFCSLETGLPSTMSYPSMQGIVISLHHSYPCTMLFTWALYIIHTPAPMMHPAYFIANCHFWHLSGYHESISQGNSSDEASCSKGEVHDAFILYGLYLINSSWLISSSL